MNQISKPKDTFSLKLTRSVGSNASIAVHTVLFAAFFILGFMGYAWDRLLLILTTLVSLEAIYLSLFIQMTINEQAESLQEVEEDIDEIQEDVVEIQEDLGEIQEDLDVISEPAVESLSKSVVSSTELDDLRKRVSMILIDIEKLIEQRKNE